MLRISVLVLDRSLTVSGDAWYYQITAADIVAGVGRPNSIHPPGWGLLLIPLELLGLGSTFPQQIFAALLGTTAVILVGFCGRSIAGDRAGLLAAGIAALHPGLWVHERTLLPEVPVLPLAALLILLSYAYWNEPRLRDAVAIGLVIGCLGLIRSEQLLLLLVLAGPLLLSVHAERLTLRERIGFMSAATLAAIFVIAPWLVYVNTTSREPVMMSTNFGYTLGAANCPGTYDGPLIGSVNPECWNVLTVLPGDASEQAAGMRERGLSFARDNRSRLPLVILARQGRTWGFFRPVQQAEIDADFAHGRDQTYLAATVVYWLLLPIAIVGALELRRRNYPVYILAAPVVVGVIATALTLGQARARAPAELALVLLAAVALDHWLGKSRNTTTPGATAREQAAPDCPHDGDGAEPSYRDVRQ